MSAPLDRMLGRTVCRLRQCYALSQADIADKAGITQAAVSLIESGRKSTSLETLRNLASSLDTTASGLLAIVEEAASIDSVRDVILSRARGILDQTEGWMSLDEAQGALQSRGKRGAS